MPVLRRQPNGKGDKVTVYKKANQIFDRWENDKTYIVTLVSKTGNSEMDSWIIYSKDIQEARRLSQFWLGESGKGLTWKILGVEPKRR
jgi:hypothetical protein